jgi:hypothetical protein
MDSLGAIGKSMSLVRPPNQVFDRLISCFPTLAAKNKYAARMGHSYKCNIMRSETWLNKKTRAYFNERIVSRKA